MPKSTHQLSYTLVLLQGDLRSSYFQEIRLCTVARVSASQPPAPGCPDAWATGRVETSGLDTLANRGPGRPLNWCLDTSFPEVSWAVKASEGVGRKVHLNNTGHLATCSVLLGPVVPDSCFAGSNRSKRIGHSLLNDDHDGNCKPHVALGRWTNR